MNIITTDIIPAKYDVFWENIAADIDDMPPRPLLVITTLREAGSVTDTQLLKIIDACKLSPEQYHIIDLEEGRQTAWHRLRERLRPKVVFLVGVLPMQLGVSAAFRLNEPNRFDGATWLPTLSINELEQNAEAKKNLWINGMKPVFIDKIYGDI